VIERQHRLSTALSALRAAAPTARVLILLIRCGLTSPLLLALISGVLFLLCRRAATTLLLISALALFASTLLLAAALLVVLVHQFSLVGPELMSKVGQSVVTLLGCVDGRSLSNATASLR
jgi:hypothetical protein